jgi:hypothetical protein
LGFAWYLLLDFGFGLEGLYIEIENEGQRAGSLHCPEYMFGLYSFSSREREVDNYVQSVPSISNTIPFSAGASSVPGCPSGAKRRFEDAILAAVVLNREKIGRVDRVENRLLETLECSVRIYIRMINVYDRCCVKFTRCCQ